MKQQSATGDRSVIKPFKKLSVQGQTLLLITVKRIIMLLLILPFFLLPAAARGSSWSLVAMLDRNINPPASIVKTEPFFPPHIEGKDFFTSIDDLSILRRTEVRRFLNQYMKYGREYVYRGIFRSGRYMDVIDEIFKRYSCMPDDLKILPLLESGFDPNAVSRSKAVGLWQFIDGTSRRLGILNNSWVDERKSIHKSTDAALRHLKSLYDTFNSWELALAAYNGGAGHVRRAMIRSGTENFWDLLDSGMLRRETAEYVPRFAALAIMYKNPDLFLLDEAAAASAISLDLVEFDYPVDIRKIAKVTGITQNVLRAYNPEIRKNITPPHLPRYSLLIPTEALDSLMENIESVYVLKYSDLSACRVKKGDTLSAIAGRYGVKTSSIMIINDIRCARCIRPGQKLLIPR